MMVTVVILAAGASSRLGLPKQNLVYQHITLLQHAVFNALQVSANVIVVLGANTGLIEPTIKDKPITILHNEDWANGMASSIQVAITHIQQTQLRTNPVILMLCDQPFADAKILNQLISEKNISKKGIIASAYKNALGVPVLFDVTYFSQLLLLRGQDGAKVLLKQFLGDVQAVPFDLGVVDIDTLEDWERLLNKTHN